MRELFLVNSDSTDSSLVLRAEGGEEFFLAVTEELRALCAFPGAGSPAAGSAEASPAGEDAPGKEAAGEEATGSPDSAQAAATPPRLGLVGADPAREKKSEEPAEKVRLRPAEIQNQVRAGASAAEIAAQLGVPESRIEPFAYPVMLERGRIAELAKQAHPMLDGEPAKLTLWQILATAFATRGHSLSESTWDAYRHHGESWVVRVSWKAGLSENVATWSFHQTQTSPPTVEALDSVAADLTDPDFVQPVRSLTSVGRGERYAEAIDGEEPVNVTRIADYSPAGEGRGDTPGADGPVPAASADEADKDGTAEDRPEGGEPGDGEAKEDEGLLQHPPAQAKPAKRRRKAVTPHWEDVLLGVRSSTKRPRE